MASGLRTRAKINYAVSNDLPSDVLKLIREKQTPVTWKPNQSFPVEVISNVATNSVKIHYTGYGKEYDAIVDKSELINKIPVGGVNGPIDINSFISVLKLLIMKELGSPNSTVVDREIRIETNHDVIHALLKALNVSKFPARISLATWERLLENKFYHRIVTPEGDSRTIKTAIDCRVHQPMPQVFYKPVKGQFLENHIIMNPVFVANFAITVTSAKKGDSFEYL